MKPIHPKCCITSTGEPSKKQEFVHLFCSQWIPETFIRAEDTAKMEPVQNVNAISKDRFKLLCSICKQRHGACIQCSHGMCATSFHPLCARAAGLRMEVVGYEGSDDIDLKGKQMRRRKKIFILSLFIFLLIQSLTKLTLFLSFSFSFSVLPKALQATGQKTA